MRDGVGFGALSVELEVRRRAIAQGNQNMKTTTSLTVYEYPKCSTCKNALKYLDARGAEYRKIDISQQPPTKAELKRMVEYYGGAIRKLLNTSGSQYRELKLNEKIDQMTENDVIELLSKNGKLVKRPFLLADGAGRVGFKKEEWDTVLK